LIAIALGISAIASAFHMVPRIADKFSASKAEILWALLAVIVWLMALPVITGPDRNLAVSGPAVVNANLYFSSWGAFICSLLVLYIVGKQQRATTMTKDFSANRWFWLVLATIVALASASRLYHDADCTNDSGLSSYFEERDEYCDDLKVGFSMSVICAFFAVFMAVFAGWAAEKEVLLAVCGSLIGAVVLTLQCINLAYVTFGNGPGSVVGNLFFSTWLSFILAVNVTVSHVKAFLTRETSSTTTDDVEGGQPGPVPEVDPTHNEPEGDHNEPEGEGKGDLLSDPEKEPTPADMGAEV
jgi:hypothetical protein